MISYHVIYQLTSTQLIWYHITYHIISYIRPYIIPYVMFHMSSHVISHTVWCRYNAVNFITNIHERHPMARPLRRGMGCLLWIHHLIDIMSQFLQFSMQNLSILDRVLTALDCIMPYHIYHIQYIIYIIAYTTSITKSYIISYIIPCITSYIIYVIYHWPLKELVIWSTKAVWICHPHRNWIGVINALRRKDSAWSTLTKWPLFAKLWIFDMNIETRASNHGSCECQMS